MLDPALEMEDVQRTFAGVGASDSLVEEQFWQWCMSLFGDFNDVEFEAQIEELIEAYSHTRRREGYMHITLDQCALITPRYASVDVVAELSHAKSTQSIRHFSLNSCFCYTSHWLRAHW